MWSYQGDTMSLSSLLITLCVTLCFTLTAYCLDTRWKPNSVYQFSELEDVKIFDSRSVKKHGYNFKVLSIENDHMLVGARNKVHNISMVTLEENFYRISWEPDVFDIDSCKAKYGKNQEQCQNYIRVLGKQGPDEYYICGTNAFRPSCKVFKYDGASKKFVKQDHTDKGVGYCPFDPEDNSTFVYTEGNLYSATVSDFQRKDPLIIETRGKVRTEQYDSGLLNKPDFVGSLDTEDKVYFFFRELAVEQMDCGKTVYSRVARVCKSDIGGPKVLKMDKSWTSFFKARLECSIPGDFPFHFNEIQSVSEMDEGNHVAADLSDDRERMLYAVFNTPKNSIRGSAVCAFKLSDLTKTFQGRFKEKKSTEHIWQTVSESDIPTPHPEGCVNNSQQISQETMNFIKSHSLMEAAVPAAGSAPVLVNTNSGTRFTAITVDWQYLAAGGRYYDVMFVGTDNGRVLKSINRGTGSGLESIVIEDLQILGKHEPVRSLKLYRSNPTLMEGRLIVIGRDSIVSVPLHRCNKQTTECGCLALQDPYCSWDISASKCQYNSNGAQSIMTGTSDRCPKVSPTVEEPQTTVPTTEKPKTTCPACKCNCPKPTTTVPTAVVSNENDSESRTEKPSKDVAKPPVHQPTVLCESKEKDPDSFYTASTLAIAIVVSIVVSMLAGFVIGYRVSLCRKNAQNMNQLINNDQQFGSLRKNHNRRSMDVNIYCEPGSPNHKSYNKNFVSNYVPPSKSANLPNGSIETKPAPLSPTQGSKTYV